jgi:chemotaxis protein methyltransferase CheR
MTLILEPELAPFKELLRQTCGFSFTGDRERTLQDGLAQRMALGCAPGPGTYLARLRDDPGELDRLVELLTVNETYFLREPAHLDLLVDKLVPERLAEHPDPVRILCAGCSTGEEPYSVAMLLQDRADPAALARFTITGVDLDARAIAKAQAAAYGRYSFRGMDPGFEARHFEPAGPQEKRVKEPVRSRVQFAVLNLLAPSYPPQLEHQDLILYRNVSIYFPGPVQLDVFRRLAALLRPGGYLLVGAAETLVHAVGILQLEERDSLYVFRKAGGMEIQDRRRARRTPPGPDRTPGPGTPAGGAAAIREGARAADPPAPRPRPAAPGPARARGLFDDALDCARGQREPEALAILATLLEAQPGHVRAHTLKACVLLALARSGEARSAAEAALALDPLCLEACLILGLVSRQEGDDLGALKRFREAIYLDASCWFAHYGQAEILAAKGERARARTGFETALRLLAAGDSGQGLFPLKFNAEEFVTLCRHKLARLQDTR